MVVEKGPTTSHSRGSLRNLPYPRYGPNPQAISDILIDGFRVSVTTNLEVALRHLRSETVKRLLWVDAVCINQQDDMEKSEQVKMMRDIFSSAQKVLAWSGEASYDSDEAMDTLIMLQVSTDA